jgi:hypothetical protein
MRWIFSSICHIGLWGGDGMHLRGSNGTVETAEKGLCRRQWMSACRHMWNRRGEGIVHAHTAARRYVADSRILVVVGSSVYLNDVFYGCIEERAARRSQLHEECIECE